MKVDIKSLDLKELTAFVETLGEKPFRAKQIYQWLHVKQVASFEEMTNISKTLIEKLNEEAELVTLSVVEVQKSQIDGTRKYLFGLSDGNVIESVLMRYKHGNSVCISSQVGCRMGCRFCASTLDGLVRNLKPSEMLLKFIELLTDENGINISQRNLTVSTCGIVPRMKELAEKNLQITLALSLHASTQEKRLQLMPVANKYEIHEVVNACRYYFEKTGRRVTFEYSLVGGVNDTDTDVKNLCTLIKGLNCHVNLIPVNPIKEREFVSPDTGVTLAFKNKLEKNGINVTIRREMGRDIDGACGQLRKRYMGQQKERLA